MNQQLQEFARNKLLEGLTQLPAGWQERFKLRYARDNGRRSVEDAKAMPISAVVAQMPEDTLDWALTQVQNSLDKQSKETTMTTTAQAPQTEGIGLYNWLDKVSHSGLPDVEHAARVLKDYYEGVDSNDPRSLTQQHIAKAQAAG